MTRSVWKGPFVDGYLLKKADAVRESGRLNEVIKINNIRCSVVGYKKICLPVLFNYFYG